MNKESIRNLIGFQSVFKDTFFYTLSKIFSNLFYLIFISSLIKIAGEKNYGFFTTFLMVSQFIYICFLLPFNNGIIRFGREEFIQKNKINNIVFINFIFIIPIIIILILLLFFFRHLIVNYINYNNKIIFFVLLFFILNHFLDFTYYILQAIGKIQLMAFAQIIEKFIPLLFLFLCFVLSTKISLFYTIIFIISGFICSIFFIFLFFDLKIFSPFSFDKNLFIRYIKYTIPIIFGSVLSYFLNWFDIVIIKKFLTIELTGRYFFCYQLFNGYNQLNIVFLTVILPLITSLVVKKRYDLIEQLLSNISFAFFVIFSFSTNFIVLFAYFILWFIYKDNFFSLSLSSFILLFTVTISFLLNFFAALMHALEKTFSYSINSIIVLLLKIILSYFLIQRFGIIGAAISSFVASLTFLYLYIFNDLYKYFKIKIFYFTSSILLTFVYILIYALFKNIYLSFFINSVLLFFFAKYFKIFQKDKLLYLNELDIPLPLKNILKIIIEKFNK
ncbi:MAG TPA: oligosaccharide flippase family protein [bacterium]|nr:oligosaccharide flippase family protein [bacterium]HOL48206.1 oligosaccharide flippase family protein [bacterium]HPQ19192.1 oligosaccharide flippase family protein [bacterium]